MRARSRAAVAVGVLAFLACARPDSGQLLSVGSHRLEIRQQGEGRPIVVLDTGIGAGLDRLIPLQDRIAEVTRTVAYNRRALSRKSSNGSFVLAPEASHHLDVDSPRLVAGCVLELARSIGAAPPPRCSSGLTLPELNVICNL